VHANASHHCNLDYEQIAREILKEAAEVDVAEDELFGDARGDELPPEFRSTGELRRCLREAKQRLDARRAAEKKPVPRSRAERLEQRKKRLEQELELERRVRADYRAWRGRGRREDRFSLMDAASEQGPAPVPMRAPAPPSPAKPTRQDQQETSLGGLR
jgi:hypothetical protein